MNIDDINIFCINLDRRPDRWSAMQEEFKKHNLYNVRRWSAVDHKQNNITPPVLACSMSHLALLQHAYDNNYPYVLILEDDTILAKNFNSKLIQYVSELPYDWGVFSLHCYKSLTENISDHTCLLSSMMFGTHGILIHRKSIKQILDTYKMDCTEKIYFDNLKIYAPKKEFTLAFQNAKDSDLIETNVLDEYANFYNQYGNCYNNTIVVVRPTYYDRSAMLQLSLEYQKEAEHSDKFETYIFVDPHKEHGIVSDYDKVITDEYKRINWTKNSGKYSWYDSVKYIFDNTDYEYVITIEDDVLISKDYLRMCEQLSLHDGALSKDDNILYFHIGAWEKPRGNPNKIVRSGVSSRSILINRKKFEIIKKWVEEQKSRQDFDLVWSIKDNDHMISNVLKDRNMTTIAPETNRHGHIGIYGWSATGFQKVSHDGQSALFDKHLSHEELYSLLKENCLSGSKLLELNQNKNPNYFWDFDPNINFTKLEYDL